MPMTKLLPLILSIALATGHAETHALSDGKTFDGWEPGTKDLWHIEDGAFVGGSLAETVPHNDFLSTVKSYKNFELRLKFKLNGTGFVNGGVQFRSDRIPNFEMSGYQADMGDPAWWGCLYDESRRNKVLVQSPTEELKKVLNHDGWNDYRIRCEGPHIQLWINGLQTVDYTEADAAIPRDGKIGLQIHGGGKAQAWYKAIAIEELPDTPAAAVKQPPGATPEKELTTFHLPPGFVAELVADESVMRKAVAFNFDTAGRMWVTTASEYPLDGNEQPERAAALYRDGGKDTVLIFDTPCAPGLQKPRLFAGDPDGTGATPFKLAMPMGVLPYKDGAIIQHGPELLFLHDTNGDGRADTKQVLLSGFGVDDSHLMPHGFLRGPGDWIYFEQGAFNHSHVKTKEGPVVNFQYCKVMRMKPDGSHFEIVGWGPCNDWGFVIDPRGRMWGQEANDYGFPMYPFEIGIAIPGIGDDKAKPYAPMMTPPKKVNDCTVGGTGLSGLAMSEDASSWPAPYTGAFILANPITNKLQAMKAHQEGPGWEGVKLEMLGDFLRSDDASFRPVAIQFGPDGALYLNDWYNKIISHNEVPRNHPDRDKVRTRIWRVRWVGAAKRDIPNLKKLEPAQLIPNLASANQWEANAARCELIDRANTDTVLGQLTATALSTKESTPKRLQALWVLAGRHATLQDKALEEVAFTDPDANIRREFTRAAPELTIASDDSNTKDGDILKQLAAEKDPEVRIARQHALKRIFSEACAKPEEMTAESLSLALVSVPAPNSDLGLDGAMLRYLTRANVERYPAAVKAFLDGPGKTGPIESRLLAALSLPPQDGAPRLAQMLPEVTRPLVAEEISLLAGQIAQPAVATALADILKDPKTQAGALASIAQLDPRVVTSMGSAGLESIAGAAKALLGRDPSDANRMLILHLARSQHVAALEPEVAAVATNEKSTATDLIESVKALRELGSERLDLFKRFATTAAGSPVQTEELHREAVTALAGGKSPEVVRALAELWPQLPPVLRTIALDKLSSSKAHAAALVQAARTGRGFKLEDIDDVTLDKLVTVLGAEQADVAAILAASHTALAPVLRLSGGPGSIAETAINLSGPFTVETWIKLDEGISNEDAVLGAKGGPCFNFYDGRYRIYIGRDGIHDALAAKTAMRPDLWSHVAITRDEGGHFRIYIHGELDAEGGAVYKGPLTGLDVGRTGLPKGTAASFTEFRVWDVARSPAEILDNYQRSFAGSPIPPHLVKYIPGAGPWGALLGDAHVIQTRDFPELLSPEAASAQDAKFAHFRLMIAKPGNAEHGHALFATTCTVCHRAKGEGAQIGPELSGAGAMGDESLLRNILTPNLQIESGYYRFDVQLKSGDLVTGFFLREDASSVTIRPIGLDDRIIPRSEILHTKIARKSIMPDGLLDAMKPADVADLFAFLRTLK